MTRTPLLIMLAAAAALAGCNKKDHTIVAGPDTEANETNAAAAAPVALPPSIESSKTYRCDDNSVVYVDWMSDGSAHVKKKSGEVPTVLAAGSPDIKGDAKATTVTYKGQTCKA
jgi:hypothetical protein